MVHFKGFSIVKSDLNEINVGGKALINTISPNSYGLSIKDKEMNRALKGSDYLILDGVYFGWWPLFTKGIRIKRITGWDSFQFFSQKTNELSGKIFFLGSSEETLMKIRENFKRDFPNVKVEYYSPPFKVEFSAKDNEIMRDRINAFSPDVLFVGMTAPKQEKWSYQNKSYLNAKVISTIGNVFDWYAGNTKRPSIFWQKIGMEWLVRIFLRPEVFKRNIGNQMLFFWHLILYILKIKKS